VASDIPAGTSTGVREQGVSARDIFLGANRIDLVLNLVVFFSDGQNTRAMNGAVRDTQFRGDAAQLVPAKIGKIKKQEEAGKCQREAADERSGITPASKIGISHRLKKPEKASSSQLRRLYQQRGSAN